MRSVVGGNLCEGGSQWSVPVALDDGGDRCRPCSSYSTGSRAPFVVTIWQRREPHPQPGGGAHYTWDSVTVPAGAIDSEQYRNDRSENPEHAHTIVTGRITVGWPDPGTLTSREAVLVDPYERRWEITRTTVRPGALELELRRFERSLTRGDAPWA